MEQEQQQSNDNEEREKQKKQEYEQRGQQQKQEQEQQESEQLKSTFCWGPSDRGSWDFPQEKVSKLIQSGSNPKKEAQHVIPELPALRLPSTLEGESSENGTQRISIVMPQSDLSLVISKVQGKKSSPKAAQKTKITAFVKEGDLVWKTKLASLRDLFKGKLLDEWLQHFYDTPYSKPYLVVEITSPSSQSRPNSVTKRVTFVSQNPMLWQALRNELSFNIDTGTLDHSTKKANLVTISVHDSTQLRAACKNEFHSFIESTIRAAL